MTIRESATEKWHIGRADTPGGGDRAAELPPHDEGVAPGDQVGAYRIVAEIGRGGMAVVYLAERADGAFAQQVALKVVKRGVDTDEVLTRFRQERQILATLTHPNIARLFDGGVTPDGRPFLAMELVRGEPIDRYCERLALDVNARVDLVVAVARAVQHAHRRLVVHRDLKPSNILITADGEVKLLDFGIAKLLDPNTADFAAPPTRTALRVMTPEYASPEQVRGEAITTASDVYQLGLILFELLTGRRAQRLTGLGATEAERVVCDQPPPRPSTAVGGGDAPSLRMRGLLRGDLDNIVLTALSKEPERRYASVERFLDDLVRYRQGLTVAARGSSLTYRTGKFLRRHRLAVAAAAAALVMVSAIVAFYSIRLASERDRAQREAAAATQIADFLTRLFQVSDPQRTPNGNLTARELLDRGAQRIDSELAAQPDVQARMMHVIGGIYRSLGLNQQAIPLLERALATRRQRLGPNHPDVAQTLNTLGLVLYNAGRFDAARTHWEEALKIEEATLGPMHNEVAVTLNGLGLLHRRTGELEKARDVLERALVVREQALGREAADVGVVLNNLALTHQSLGNLPRARELFERALALHERHHGPDHVLVGGTLGNLAEVFRQSDDFARALPMQQRALAIAEKAYGPIHRDTGTAANALGMLLADMKRYDEAQVQLERAERVYTQALGPDHAYVAYPVDNLGLVYRALGDSRRALVQYERGLQIREKAFGPVHRDVAQSLEHIGTELLALGDCMRAVPMLERALDVTRKTMRASHPRLGVVSSALGQCAAEAHRFEAAEPLLAEGYRILSEQRGANHESTIVARRRLVSMYTAWGRPAEAARLVTTPAQTAFAR